MENFTKRLMSVLSTKDYFRRQYAEGLHKEKREGGGAPYLVFPNTRRGRVILSLDERGERRGGTESLLVYKKEHIATVEGGAGVLERLCLGASHYCAGKGSISPDGTPSNAKEKTIGRDRSSILHSEPMGDRKDGSGNLIPGKTPSCCQGGGPSPRGKAPSHRGGRLVLATK